MNALWAVGRVDGHDCVTEHCYNPVASAGDYSAFAALLAGFALASIVVLVESRRRSGEKESHDIEGALTVFVSALMSLVISSFLYATAVGDEFPSSRGAATIFLTSGAFSMATLTLFYGLVLLLRRVGLSQAASFASRTTGSIVPTLIFLFMWITAVDTHGFRDSDSEAWSSTFAYITGGLGVLVVGSAVWLQARWKAPAGKVALYFGRPDALGRHDVLPAWVMLVLTVLLAIGVAIVGEFGPDLSPAYWPYIPMFILCVAVILYMILIRATDFAPSAPRQAPPPTRR
jgi:hypothetical protein